MKYFNLSIFLYYIFFNTNIYAKASYQDISPKILIKDAEIVIIGKITKIISSSTAQNSMDTSIISINKYLKGNKEESQIKFIFSGKNRIAKSSFDISFNVGDTGIWMLKKNKNNLYRVSHPDSFQDIKTEKIIQEIINNKKINYSDSFTQAEKFLIIKYFRFEGTENEIPFFINSLKEKDNEIFKHSLYGLKRITNQIFIEKDDSFTEKEKSQIIKSWENWWESNKNFNREKWINQGINRDIDLLKNRDSNIQKRSASRLLEFTGQYGFVGSGFAPKTPEAIGKWDRWWGTNASVSLDDRIKNLYNSQDPLLRQQGIRMMAEEIRFGKNHYYKNLVKALMDPDKYVQLYAIEGLTILTGDHFDFDINISPENNLESIKKWMDWLNKNTK